MTTLVLASLAIPGSSAAATDRVSTASGGQARPVGTAALDVHCYHAHNGIRFYHGRYHTHHAVIAPLKAHAHTEPAGCPHARYRAGVWKDRAAEARARAEVWRIEQARRTLRDFEFRPGNQAWTKAVTEVQKVFPGTSGWLLSCSAAEGGHGRWVVYGGRSYWPGAEHSYNGRLQQVGGPMQFMWSTFKGMYRRGLEDVRSRGYRVPEHLRDPGDVNAWRSALGQAIAGGWARYTGNDDSHWSASWGRGC